MKKTFTPLLLILSVTLISTHVTAQRYSKILYPDSNGKLVYVSYNEKGDILPDFSYCGYMGGGVAVPDVPTKKIIEPGNFSHDDSPRIQAAINELAKIKPDKNGIRGAVLLKKGKYNIKQTIELNKSGIVLRGEGDDENGTLLIGTKKENYSLIKIGSGEKPQFTKSKRRKITDTYIPSGSRQVTVDKIQGYSVGDRIIVERVSTKEWIATIGMDKIKDSWASVGKMSAEEKEKLDQEGRLSKDGKKYNTTVQWEPGSKNISFLRTITAINGNTITLDIPLTNAFQQEYGGGYVYLYNDKNWVSQCGVEQLRGISEFDESKTKKDKYIGEYYADEKHLSTFINFDDCENAWVRHTTSQYIDAGYRTGKNSRFITIEDCKYLDPVSTITGGRRYGYNISGQMCLVQRCYGRNGRHDLVLGACVAGPNAFVDCKAEMCHASSEPHQRWATGCLFDNCSLSGPSATFSMSNRGNFGSGHGWSGAQMVVWNCKAPISVIMAPPTAQNFSIGNFGSIDTKEDKWATTEEIILRINRLNNVSGNNFRYEGLPVVGDGYIESPDNYVVPQYLYYQQLADRLGKKAVLQVTSPQQQKIIFQTNN